MPTKYCAHALCKSDSRKHLDIKWAKFVPPNVDRIRCQKWVHLCGRKEFETKNVKQWTYLCEKHFPENANLNYYEVSKKIKTTQGLSTLTLGIQILRGSL